MTLVTIGDSITKGTYTAEHQSSPNTVANPAFSGVLQELLGCDQLFNHGENGTCISSNTHVFPHRAMVLRYTEMEDADVVVLAAGTNDFRCGVPLGNPSDTGEDTFWGAVDMILRGLKEKYPKAEIYVVAPIHCHDEDNNPLGLSQDAYRDVLFKKAAEYNIPAIDGYEVPLNLKDDAQRKLYGKDGVHPNQEGHRIYGEHLYKKICEYRAAK